MTDVNPVASGKDLRGDAGTFSVRTVETAWVPMADGRRLAARLFLPETDASVPVILEYIPYRRRDGTRLGDDRMMLWFAARGYACARVDIAGTGDSDGLIGDEYIAREQDDACEIIAWLAAQAFSSGAVGMIGHSWGGFSGLQAAARRPPALKAVVSMYSTDDRYACDAHYMGGCVIDSNFNWGSAFFNYLALPPDPAVVGADRWRALWQDRIDDLTVPPAVWLRHQRRDAYWKHASVCEDFSAIQCPVLAVGGWLDGYTRTVFNLLENLTAPCKAIIGPWGHKTPEIGFPGPAIGFLQECLGWWDHWLKGIDTGADKLPDLRAYLMDPFLPDPLADHRPGRWLALHDWDSQRPGQTRFRLGADGSLGKDAPQTGAPRMLRSPVTTGQTSQDWCPYGQGRVAPDGSADQRPDDALSLCFDHAPLTQDLSIFGMGWVHLRLRSDRPQAQVAVRITDVSPDGTSTFVTFGVLNLSHRGGSETPAPLIPGTYYDVAVELKPVAQTVPRGHHLRVAVSSALWPMLWPGPEIATLELDAAGSTLELPLLAPDTPVEPAGFGPVSVADPGPSTPLVAGGQARHRTLDVTTGALTITVLSDDGTYRIDEIGTEVQTYHEKTLVIRDGDPTSARYMTRCRTAFHRSDWTASVDTTLDVTCTATDFIVSATYLARDGDAVFAERRFTETIPRDHM